ncbi:MAG: InlB B-repeat-containing protein [Oscillospiraceae bacterium]|jgi:hypothetical protein|nr:InlB B-repeat-containing protein [Oscillospiraceae bacterium]
MIKKILAIVFIFIMVSVLVPAGLFATSALESATLVSDESEFLSAVATPNFEIQLTEDFTLSCTSNNSAAKTISNSGIIDLNGHTLTLLDALVDSGSSSGVYGVLMIASDASVTITNSDSSQKGMIKRGNDSGYMFRVDGELIIQSESGAKEAVIDGGAIWDNDSSKNYYNATLGRVLNTTATGANTLAHEQNNNSGLRASGPMITLTNNGKLSAKSGSVLQNNMNFSGGLGPGGAVLVNGRQASLKIDGGTIQDCAVRRNTGGGLGGAVSTIGEVTMSGGLITRCHAAYTLSGGGGGGAVSVSANGIFVMEGGVISNNLAANGGGVYTLQSAANNSNANARFHMKAGVIKENYATYGGGVQNNNYILDDKLSLIDANGDEYFTGMLLEGGEISNNTAVSYGGGVDNDATQSASANARIAILGTTIKENRVTTASTLYTSGGGGVSIRATQAYNNVTTPSDNIIKGATIINNEAISASSPTTGSNGGGVYLYGSYANAGVFEDNTITGNRAVRGGGVYVYAQNAELTLKKNIIQNNYAVSNGGGLYLGYAKSVTLTDQSNAGTGTDYSISGNTAAGNGGGIYVGYSTSAYTSVTLNHTDIIGNKAGNTANTAGNGGGVYLFAGTVNLNEQSSVNGNTAAIAGGGVYVNRGTFSMSYNSADKSVNPAIYGNIANLDLDISSATSDDVYASGNSTTISLLSVKDMPIPASYITDGWYDDYADDENSLTRYRSGQRNKYVVSSGDDIIDTALRLTLGATIYTVTYDGNGSTSGTAPQDTSGNALTESNIYYSGSIVTVLGNDTLVKTNYTFLGWATSQEKANSGTVDYNAADTFEITKGTTLYAVWCENDNTYTVTYQPGDHGTFPEIITSGLYYGEATPSAPQTTGEENWIFTGWSPEPSENVTGSVIYVAQWKYDPSKEKEPPVTQNPTNTGNDQNPTNTGNNQSRPNTGDVSHMVLWFTLMSVGLTGLVFTIERKSRAAR